MHSYHKTVDNGLVFNSPYFLSNPLKQSTNNAMIVSQKNKFGS